MQKNLMKSFENELHRVMIHGVLHFMGYKDKTKTEEKMRTMRKTKTIFILNT